MRRMSHQTGTQIAETTKMTAAARRTGPVTPMPSPATERSTTPTCAWPFPPKSPPQPAASQPKRRPPQKSGASRQQSPAGSGRSTSASGRRFEVQFHTSISFEAKQLTHLAYERLRTPQPNKPDKFEQMVLEAFEKK